MIKLDATTIVSYPTPSKWAEYYGKFHRSLVNSLNKSKNQYQKDLQTKKKQVDALNKDPDASPKDILRNVRAAVDEFVKDEEQFDDITMLCLKYKGMEETDNSEI